MQSRIFALVVAAALAVAFFGPDGSQSIAASDVQQVAVPERDAAAPLDPARLVPVDVLGTGVVNWVPLISDGAN